MSCLSQACGALEDPQNAGCAEAVQWAFEKGLKQHPGTMCDMSSWELGTERFTSAFFFSIFYWLVCEGWYFVPLGTISRTGPSDAKIGDLQ